MTSCTKIIHVSPPSTFFYIMREQESETEPAHHARRPMNAFLIFCKRHRSVVRDKYPNLENRSITKILGEWWANLDKEDKGSYTSLAKQYKDAFFSANPDFKWYKLPAPPLRTLASRPRERIPTPDFEPLVEKTNNNSTKIDLNKTLAIEDPDKQISMFTPGKLADEAQMGGLSSLLDTKTEAKSLNPYYSPPSYKSNQISYSAERSTSDATIRELQNALTETTRVFEDLDDGDSKVYYNDQFTNQDVINQIVDKRYSKDEEYDDYNQKSWSDYDQVVKGRSCKGKRYQEFMAVGGLLVNKRQKRDCDREGNYNASCSWEPNSNAEEGSRTDDSRSRYMPKASDSMGTKAFKAEDFDLDAKIRALPSLSLEKFQQKKRDNKRKKKMVSLKPNDERRSPLIINSVPMPIGLDERREMAEKWRENVIGSQKRKPRKISITRLEINSLAPSVDLNAAQKITPELKIATEAPRTIAQTTEVGSDPREDLFALATLAEVAANTSKMDDSAIYPNMVAKVSDDNASMV